MSNATGSTTVTPATPERSRKPRRRGLSVQSKLLIMLLVASLLSAAVVGAIAWVSGRAALEDAAYDELTSVRETRIDSLTRTLRDFQAALRVAAANASAENASAEFNAAFAELEQSATVTADDDAALLAFYEDSIIPPLQANTGEVFDARALIPASAAGRYLQVQYMLPNDPYADQDAATKVEDAGDGSAWSAAHARFHDYFLRLVDNFGYEDVLLITDEGDVVYTVDKGIDLGTNLLEGPYERSVLAEAYRRAMRSGSTSAIATTDFEAYVPSLGEPAAWAVAPIDVAGDITGALAVQVPISVIDEVMTGDDGWETQGLGETGEVYLVGRDGLMRSNSRPLIQNPDGYAAAVTRNGTPPSVAEQVVAAGSTVLRQPADSRAVAAALSGETGVMISREYIGGESLTAFAPLDLADVDWVIVSRMETSEAFAPANDLTRTILVATVGILLGVSLAALLAAQFFTRPIRRLVDAVRRVAAGDLDATVTVTGRDEFSDLSGAFNEMSRSLRVKQQLIDQQQADYDKLLLTLMPASVASRYRKGEDAIAEQHQDVSVVYAELRGYDDFSDAVGAEEALSRLNELIRGFDEAAVRTGVEKVRVLREGYLASSGLMVPRIDNVRRSVDFAIEVREIVERFSAQYDTHLAVRVGVATGTVTAGLVGRTSLAYDLWGDAVNLAHRIQAGADEPGIFVSQAVRDGVGEAVTFEQAGTVDTKSGGETVWRVA